VLHFRVGSNVDIFLSYFWAWCFFLGLWLFLRVVGSVFCGVLGFWIFWFEGGLFWGFGGGWGGG